MTSSKKSVTKISERDAVSKDPSGLNVLLIPKDCPEENRDQNVFPRVHHEQLVELGLGVGLHRRWYNEADSMLCQMPRIDLLPNAINVNSFVHAYYNDKNRMARPGSVIRTISAQDLADDNCKGVKKKEAGIDHGKHWWRYLSTKEEVDSDDDDLEVFDDRGYGVKEQIFAAARSVLATDETKPQPPFIHHKKKESSKKRKKAKGKSKAEDGVQKESHDDQDENLSVQQQSEKTENQKPQDAEDDQEPQDEKRIAARDSQESEIEGPSSHDHRESKIEESLATRENEGERGKQRSVSQEKKEDGSIEVSAAGPSASQQNQIESASDFQLVQKRKTKKPSTSKHNQKPEIKKPVAAHQKHVKSIEKPSSSEQNEINPSTHETVRDKENIQIKPAEATRPSVSSQKAPEKIETPLPPIGIQTQRGEDKLVSKDTEGLHVGLPSTSEVTGKGKGKEKAIEPSSSRDSALVQNQEPPKPHVQEESAMSYREYEYSRDTTQGWTKIKSAFQKFWQNKEIQSEKWRQISSKLKQMKSPSNGIALLRRRIKNILAKTPEENMYGWEPRSTMAVPGGYATVYNDPKEEGAKIGVRGFSLDREVSTEQSIEGQTKRRRGSIPEPKKQEGMLMFTP